jgi:predicted acylesterase/phospholipase RssA
MSEKRLINITPITPITSKQLLSRRFTTAVFAGGGNRCWWQAGLLDVLSSHPCWQVNHVIGVSAGAGIATAFATGRIHSALNAAVDRFNATSHNVAWGDILKGQRPFALPHIYPDWVDSFLNADDFAKLQSTSTKVEVVIVRPAPYLPITLSAAVALGLYMTEKYWLKGYHSRVPHWLGLRAESIDLQDTKTVHEAKDWLLGSAACWPVAPISRINGRPAIDGGFYDNVPLPKSRENDANTLVLLTRHRPKLPHIFELDGRTYIQPTRPQAASSLDCTNGDTCRLTFEQGLADGRTLMTGIA